MTDHMLPSEEGDAMALGGVFREVGELLFGERFGVRLLWTLVVLVMAYLFVWSVDKAFTRSTRRVARRRRFDDQQTKALVGRTKPARLLVRIVMFLGVIIALTGVWGLTTAFAGLLAGAGFLGIVVGLAAGQSLGNIVAGFIIFYNHPFDIGDWVEIDDVQGIVEDVALGATTVLTWDNEKVTIPNRVVEGTKIKNFSHARRLRFRVPVSVEYGSHIGQALRTLVEIGKSHPDVMEEPPVDAVSVGFGASAVDLQLRVWVEPVRSSVIRVRTDLVHMIHDRFKKEGIRIAFPHMQVVQGAPWRMEADVEIKGEGEAPA